MKLGIFGLFAFLAACAYYPEAHRGVVWFDVNPHELEAPGLALSCLHRALAKEAPERPFEGVRVAWVRGEGTALTLMKSREDTLIVAAEEQRPWATQVLAHEFVHVFLARYPEYLRDRRLEQSERGHHEWMYRHGVCFGGCADVAQHLPKPAAYSRQCQERL